MEFTSSFDIVLKDKLPQLKDSWTGTTAAEDSLMGGDVHIHIEEVIGSTWDFSSETELPLLVTVGQENVTVMLYPDIHEKNSKSVILLDPNNDRFFISFSSTNDFGKAAILEHFNLTLEDELDNYKNTDSILYDSQRHML